jgi:AcrR family transcriptional regulator
MSEAAAIEPRRRLPRAEREERMLAAAEVTFAEHGFAGASMESIAQRSGITKALLYQYFGSKEGLYTACVERGRRDLFDRLEATARAESTPAGRLRALVDAYFDDLQARRGRGILFYGDAPRAAIDEMRARNAATIAWVLRLDHRDSDEEAIDLAAHLIVGAGEQVGRWWAGLADAPVDEVKRRFEQAVGAAVGAVLR